MTRDYGSPDSSDHHLCRWNITVVHGQLPTVHHCGRGLTRDHGLRLNLCVPLSLDLSTRSPCRRHCSASGLGPEQLTRPVGWKSGIALEHQHFVLAVLKLTPLHLIRSQVRHLFNLRYKVSVNVVLRRSEQYTAISRRPAHDCIRPRQTSWKSLELRSGRLGYGDTISPATRCIKRIHV